MQRTFIAHAQCLGPHSDVHVYCRGCFSMWLGAHDAEGMDISRAGSAEAQRRIFLWKTEDCWENWKVKKLSEVLWQLDVEPQKGQGRSLICWVRCHQ